VHEPSDALLIGSGPYFYTRRVQLALLAARCGIPTMYTQRLYVEAGGLLSYGASVSGAWRQVGLYVGRILKGAKPADLPCHRLGGFHNADGRDALQLRSDLQAGEPDLLMRCRFSQRNGVCTAHGRTSSAALSRDARALGCSDGA
jgi:hypothetical protein